MPLQEWTLVMLIGLTYNPFCTGEQLGMGTQSEAPSLSHGSIRSCQEPDLWIPAIFNSYVTITQETRRNIGWLYGFGSMPVSAEWSPSGQRRPPGGPRVFRFRAWGRIEAMPAVDRYGHNPHITVEVSDRRLPVRMVAGRLRNDMQHPRVVMQLRIVPHGRIAVIVADALVLPIFGVPLSRKPASL